MRSDRADILRTETVQHVNSLHAQAVALSNWLHANPEPSFEEYQAVQRMTDLLSQEGFQVKRNIAGLETAFRASFSHGAEHPHVAFLAEYDALPDLGHACGHNLIAAASWAAAVAVKRTLAAYALPGEVTVLGTPGQELYSGKAIMVDAGVFQGIDAALMVHPHHQNILDPVSMALDEFEASFRGLTAHAAETPHQGRNALNAVLVMFRAVDALRQHLPPGVLVHGIITEGGKAVGMVPGFAQARFACRANDREVLDEVSRRLRQCAEGAALATETTVSIEPFEPRVDNMVHDPSLAALFRSNWEYYVDEILRGRDCASMGAMDTGNVSHVVPTIQPLIAAAPVGIEHHTGAFADAMAQPMAHEALLIASRVLALTGLDVLLSAS